MERMSISRMMCVAAACCVLQFTAGSARAYTPGKELEKFANQERDALIDAQVQVSRQPVYYDVKERRDPFLPYIQEDTGDDKGAAMASEKLEGYTLEGLVWGTKLPQAIINSKVVKVGDQIGPEVKVLEITKEGVVLFSKSKNYKIAAPGLSKPGETSKKGGK